MKKLFYFLLLFSNTTTAQENLDRGLRAYYPFSGNAKDATGNKNDPIFNNATLTADRFGNPNSAYHFNGTNNYMRIANDAALNTKNKLTLCAWIRPMGFYAGTCHGNAVIMKGNTDYLPGNYLLRFDDAAGSKNQNCFGPVNRSAQNFYGVGAMKPPPGYTPYIKPGQWYSVVVTLDGRTAKLYVNCVLEYSRPQDGGTFTNSHDLFLGRMYNDQYPYWFNGDLDEVRIYDRALSDEEIKILCDKKEPVLKPDEITQKEKPVIHKNKPQVELKPDQPQQTEQAAQLKTTFTGQELMEQVDEAKLNNMPPVMQVKLEPRANETMKTIIVDHDSIFVTLYDNGEIDGDSITLIYNDSILATHKMLTGKPLTFIIKITPGSSGNELIMYAENLGSIPPNTALMVIYDGDKRYEVSVRSNLNTSGAVSFKLRE